MGIERRESPRFDVNVPVKFRDLEELQTEELKNLSRGGCLAVSKKIRPVNSKVPITLVHPVTGEQLDIMCEVKRVQPMPNGSWALGLQFVGFDSGLKLRIHRFVESVTEPAAAAPSTTAAPAPAQAPAPWSTSGAPRTLTDKKVDEYAAAAAGAGAGAEKNADASEALRYIDLALALAPNRADLHYSRARLLMDRDLRSAASHVNRAVELEPSNQQYLALARECAQHLSSAGSPGAATATSFGPSSGTPAPARRAVDGKKRGPFALAATLVLAAMVGFNVWFLLYRGALPIRSVDPIAFEAVVPMTKLQITNGRAYGIVKSGWNELPDREGKVAALAGMLKNEGANEVLLTDGGGRLVATWRGGNAKLFTVH